MDTLRTDYGLYYPSDLEVLKPIFSNLRGTFLDLGSGLGNVVQAAYLCGLQSSGIEASEALWRESKCRDRIELGNMLGVPISGYDYVYYYLTGCKEESKLFEKIKKEVTGNVIISNFTLPADTLDAVMIALNLDVSKRYTNVVIGRVKK